MWGILRLLSSTILILDVYLPKATAQSPNRAPPSHPLDPLNEKEIDVAVETIGRFFGDDLALLKFNTITLKEPEKSLLLPFFLQDKFPPPGIIARKAFAVVIDRATGNAFEVTVNIDRKIVERWAAAPNGANTVLSPEEMMAAVRIIKEDPYVIKRCNDLGWTNMSLVDADHWSIGYIGDRREFQGRKLLMMVMFGSNFPGDNLYAHPFDFRPVVDLNEGRVISVEEVPTHTDFDGNNKEGNSVPRASSNYNPDLRDPSSFRRDQKPLHITQPEGASYTISGNEIQWQKFKFRLGFNGREGVVLHHVSYRDGAEVRPLFYRMSVAEMFVPYGDPRTPFHRMHVFDEGQYGTGFCMFPLDPEKDCIGAVHFFDSVVHNEKGKAVRTPRAICVTEEDDGILWKHSDFRNNKNSVIRARRLSILSVATVGNYDYILKWNFYQDGSIEFTVRLTGVVLTSLVPLNMHSAGYGTTVFPQVNALYHQHFFTLRVDPEIDGSGNSVAMQEVVPLPWPTGSPQNPYGQGFTTKTTILRTAGEAKMNTSPKSSRTWDMINPTRLNPYSNKPVAYKLIPWNGPSLLMHADSPIRALASWLNYDTWVTPYSEGQRFPGGDYIGLTKGIVNGLPNWVEDNPNANVEEADVVLWHSLGITHIPRTEDFPVMPIETLRVKFKPVNFFLENPAIDVPPREGLRQRKE